MDRNSTYVTRLPRAQVSLSARRAWIEIWLFGPLSMHTSVALRKESVDRNARKIRTVAPDIVALRKESVDRNIFLTLTVRNVLVSLSARRAWIEMMIG